MKRIGLCSFIFLFVGMFFQTSFACSCLTVEPEEKDVKKLRESVRKYYLQEFKGAVFTGKVIRIETVQTEINQGSYILERKVTVQIEKYWLGVKTPQITIFTGDGGGDCGIDFELNNSYFFTPQNLKGVLHSNICQYSNDEAMKADGKRVDSFNKLLGKAKTFPKNNSR